MEMHKMWDAGPAADNDGKVTLKSCKATHDKLLLIFDSYVRMSGTKLNRSFLRYKKNMLQNIWIGILCIFMHVH